MSSSAFKKTVFEDILDLIFCSLAELPIQRDKGRKNGVIKERDTFDVRIRHTRSRKQVLFQREALLPQFPPSEDPDLLATGVVFHAVQRTN